MKTDLLFIRILIGMLIAFVVQSGLFAQSASSSGTEVKLLAGSKPAYPLQARRFNVQGIVRVKLNLDKRGRVVSSEIVDSPAYVLSDAVKSVVRSWRFTPPPMKDKDSYELIFPIPFSLGGSDATYAFDTNRREPKEIPPPSRGFQPGKAEVRLLIDSKGSVTDFLITRVSSVDLMRRLRGMIPRWKFSGISNTEKRQEQKYTAMNIAFVDVSEEGVVTVYTFSGNIPK